MPLYMTTDNLELMVYCNGSQGLSLFPEDMFVNARAFWKVGPLCDYFFTIFFQLPTGYISKTFVLDGPCYTFDARDKVT